MRVDGDIFYVLLIFFFTNNKLKLAQLVKCKPGENPFERNFQLSNDEFSNIEECIDTDASRVLDLEIIIYSWCSQLLSRLYMGFVLNLIH